MFSWRKKLLLALPYLIRNSAPSSSSQLTLNYKQLRFSMLFSPAVKDTDLEHALLFSLLKLSIVVIPPEKQGFLFQYDPSNAECVTRLCLVSGSWGQEATRTHSRRKNPPCSEGSSPHPHKKPHACPEGRARPLKRASSPAIRHSQSLPRLALSNLGLFNSTS